MGLWSLMQLMVNVGVILGLGILWYRFKRPAAEDPRLSRGLQLLQSKIAVLEDLSDRTDHQVKTLTHLLDQKSMMLQGQLMESENQVRKIEQTMEKNKYSMEEYVSEMNPKIAIERDDTAKYVQAAQLAHSGGSIEEMQREIALPREQLELISKMNKKQLMYDQQQLPSWVTKAARRTNAPSATQDTALNSNKNSIANNLKEESKLFSSAHSLAQKIVDSAALILETDASGSAKDPMKDRYFFPVEPETKSKAPQLELNLDLKPNSKLEGKPDSKSDSKEVKKFVFPRI